MSIVHLWIGLLTIEHFAVAMELIGNFLLHFVSLSIYFSDLSHSQHTTNTLRHESTKSVGRNMVTPFAAIPCQFDRICSFGRAKYRKDVTYRGTIGWHSKRCVVDSHFTLGYRNAAGRPECRYGVGFRFTSVFSGLRSIRSRKLRKTTMVVSVIGLGYVGLSLSVLLSRKFPIHAVDIDDQRVQMLLRCQSPIDDPDISSHLRDGELQLSPTTDFDEAVRVSEFAVVATPTDYDPDTNSFDVTSVRSVVGRALKVNPEINVVIKSTIPIGFVDELSVEFGSDRIYFSPEFLREGRALHDNLYPSRIIIGGDSEACRGFADMLVACSELDECPVLFMGTREAEAVKLFANTYLAMRVAYFNELDSFCLSTGLTTLDVINGVCLEPRIGQGYNNPSFGYGGYCFPKDTKQMVANFGDIPQKIISAVVSSNESRFDFLAGQIMQRSPDCVGVHRLSMKSGSDNYRQSAVFGLVRRLQKAGIDVIFFEPTCPDSQLQGMRKVDNIEMLKAQADVIIANRMAKELDDVATKVFSRDVFNTD